MNLLRMKIEITDERDVYFISDAHFWHKNVIRFDSRPFENIVDMNEKIIQNWQATVRPDDVVFYLGDFAFASKRKINELAGRLTGKIHLIMGNHDKYNTMVNTGRFEGVYDYGEIHIDDGSGNGHQMICMAHYPILSWNKHHRGAWHLHGHCHNNMRTTEVGKQYYKRKVEDLGLNHWNYTPVSFETLKDVMDKKDIANNVDHH